MRSRPAAAGAAVTLAATGLFAGCHTTSVVPVAVPVLADSVVVPVGRRTTVVHHPELLGDTVLTGWVRPPASSSAAGPDSTLVRIPLPLHAVRRELDAGRTLLAVAAVTGAVLTIAFVALLSAVGY